VEPLTPFKPISRVPIDDSIKQRILTENFISGTASQERQRGVGKSLTESLNSRNDQDKIPKTKELD
jgi:hypothetical protein